MSMLDQAFIKAYRVDAGRKAETPPPHAPPTTPAAAKTATKATAESRYYVDDAHPASFAPHYGAAAAPAHQAGEPIVEQARRLAARLAKVNSAAGAHADTVVLPVEDEPVETTTTAEVVEMHDEDFVPAFETQRFHWPRRAEVLIAAAGDEFASFAEELDQRRREGRNTLVVTGAMRGEGRTTLVLALARLAANRGLRTIVVDADLRSPQLAEQLGLRPETGWDDVQSERLPAADAVVESIDDHVSLLPLRSGFANPRALAGGGFLRGAIEQLRKHYDLVLVDVGPLGDDAETIDLAAALCGCALDDALVVRDRRRTTPKQVNDVCRRVAALGIRHWDVVENFTEIQGY
jgi:Mrp family chromosome partitioning ATPase